MTLLRGEQGAVEFNDTVIVSTRSWTLDVNKDALDASGHGNNSRIFVGSTASGSGTVELIYDLGVTDQATFVENVVNASSSSIGTFELFTSDTVDRIESYKFTGIVTDMDIESAVGNLIVVTCGFTTSGNITSRLVVKNLLTSGGDQLITQSDDNLTGKVPIFL